MQHTEADVSRLNAEIADLKAEIVELSGKVRSGIEDAQRSIRPAIGVIKDNPGTVSSVAFTAGLVGVAIGFALGAMRQPANGRWQ